MFGALTTVLLRLTINNAQGAKAKKIYCVSGNGLKNFR